MFQVAIVLGLISCPENACETISPSEPVDVDNVLFSGPWTPMLGGPPQLGFHQNFTVEVPELDSGVALLTLTQLVLIGVSASTASASGSRKWWLTVRLTIVQAGNGPLLLQSGITLNVV